MKLNRQEQLQAITTALLLGATQYRNDAANQNAAGNQDGAIFAISRERFLNALMLYVTQQSNKGTFADEHPKFTETLDDIAAVAGARVRGTLEHSATVKKGEPRSGEGFDNRES